MPPVTGNDRTARVMAYTTDFDALSGNQGNEFWTTWSSGVENAEGEQKRRIVIFGYYLTELDIRLKKIDIRLEELAQKLLPSNDDYPNPCRHHQDDRIKRATECAEPKLILDELIDGKDISDPKNKLVIRNIFRYNNGDPVPPCPIRCGQYVIPKDSKYRPRYEVDWEVIESQLYNPSETFKNQTKFIAEGIKPGRLHKVMNQMKSVIRIIREYWGVSAP